MMCIPKLNTKTGGLAYGLAVWLILSVLTIGSTAMATPVYLSIRIPKLIGTTGDLTGDSDWADAVSDMKKQPNSYGKNDHPFNVNWLVDHYVSDAFSDLYLPEDLTLLGKYGSGEDESPYFSVFEYGSTWGSWYEVSQEFDGPIYFSVKAGNEFALYYAMDIWDSPSSGQELPWSYWRTDNGHGMSHISFWTAGEDSHETPASVPEPATLMLLGIGILGIARIGRKGFT